MNFLESNEWKMGDTAQRKYAKNISKLKGYVVLPTYGMDEVANSTKAPVLFSKTGLLVAPDVLLLSPTKKLWQDVKSKTKPSWHRKNRRWEHGCDYSISQEYREVQMQTGIPVGIVIHEVASPLNDFEFSEMSGPEKWLFATLDVLLSKGEHRKDWPGGKANPHRRGRRGMGGLIWARQLMYPITF